MFRMQTARRAAVGFAACALALAMFQAPLSHAKGVASPAKAAPAVIAPLTVYDCPAAGCKFESAKAGMCPTHKLKLQKMSLGYTCPADNKPVAHGGKCPRCEANAIEHRMAMASAKPAAKHTTR